MDNNEQNLGSITKRIRGKGVQSALKSLMLMGVMETMKNRMGFVDAGEFMDTLISTASDKMKEDTLKKMDELMAKVAGITEDRRASGEAALAAIEEIRKGVLEGINEACGEIRKELGVALRDDGGSEQ